MTEFALDPRLEADTIHIQNLDVCEVRLMNDIRWPWLILVPRILDAVELHSLFTDQRQDIDLEVAQVAGLLKAQTGCTKINTASIGNLVRQLHIHVIARTEGDPNWPGPVWGHGSREAYPTDQAEEFIKTIRAEL